MDIDIYQDAELLMDSFKCLIAEAQENFKKSGKNIIISNQDCYKFFKKYIVRCTRMDIDFERDYPKSRYSEMKQMSKEKLKAELAKPCSMLDYLYHKTFLENSNKKTCEKLYEELKDIGSENQYSYVRYKGYVPSKSDHIDYIFRRTLEKTKEHHTIGLEMRVTNEIQKKYGKYPTRMAFSKEYVTFTKLLKNFTPTSISNNKKHYKKAPITPKILSFKKGIRRIAAVSLAAALAVGGTSFATSNKHTSNDKVTSTTETTESTTEFYQKNNTRPFILPEEEKPSENFSPIAVSTNHTETLEQQKARLKDQIKTKEDLLLHFKNCYAEAFQELHPDTPLKADDFKILLIEQTQAPFKVTKGNETFYVTRDAHPVDTENALQKLTDTGIINYTDTSDCIRRYRFVKPYPENKTYYDDHGNPVKDYEFDSITTDPSHRKVIAGNYCIHGINNLVSVFDYHPELVENLSIVMDANTLTGVNDTDLSRKIDIYVDNYFAYTMKEIDKQNADTDEHEI